MTFLNLEQIRRDGEAFYERALPELARLGFDTGALKPDHLCFRVATPEEYAAHKKVLAGGGRLLSEAQIHGRPISTFRLAQPFQTSSGPIDLIELPFPGKKAYATGFEHMEFVIRESFASLRARHPSLDFHLGKSAPLNAELSLKTSFGQAKFHHVPLDRVIEIEEARFTDVLFDMDSTLIRSHDSVLEANRRTIETILGRPVSHAEIRERKAPTFPILFENFGITDEDKKRRGYELWPRFISELPCPAFEGMTELLAALHAKGVRLHVWTARERSSTMKALAEHGWENFFTSVNVADENGTKPEPKTLLWDWKASPPNTVAMVGDSMADIRGAKNIGAVAIGALWEEGACENTLAREGAELYFRDLKDFISWMETAT
jgi:phosphoglycolate phosphatase-like HAD superfamily hydrolase/predicted metalloenzyme YecM